MKTHTIQEFLKEYELNRENKFIGLDDTWNSSFVSQLINDFGIPDNSIEFVGCLKNEYNSWDEYMILYRFPQKSEAKELGEYLKYLGKLISRLSVTGYNFGIQEVRVSDPDGYYFLIYGISEKEK